MDEEIPSLRGGADVLNEHEEALLSNLRGIVTGVRARFAESETTALVATLIAAGASKTSEGPDPGTFSFVMEGVAFTLRRSSGHTGGIEVRFASGTP